MIIFGLILLSNYAMQNVMLILIVCELIQGITFVSNKLNPHRTAPSWYFGSSQNVPQSNWWAQNSGTFIY